MAYRKGTKKAAESSDDSLLKEVRDRFDAANASDWHGIFAEGREDMAFVAGDPWDDNDKAQRKGRATVAPDELHQYFNQVINDLRAHPLGIKFTPTGNGANDKGAEFYANKSREIEYRSKAADAYITAAENAIQRSYGWVRVTTKYSTVPGQRFNQDIWIEHVPNPDMVLPDPDAKQPDSRDMGFLFFHEEWLIDEFKRRFPKAKIKNFQNDHRMQAPRWIKDRNLLLAEYWTIKTTKRTLLLLQPKQVQQPSGAPLQRPELQEVFKDDLAAMPDGATVLREREIDHPEVCQYLTNGVEILEQHEWPGKYIPFVSCFGKVIYVNNKRSILSMTRFGRAPWKSYCYAASQQLEVLGMMPKAPAQGVKGQFRGHETQWQKAQHEPVPYLEYNAITEATGPNVLGPPQRLDYPAAEHLQATEIVKEGWRRAIQAAMGTNFLPTQAQRRNEKSGVALQKMEDSADRGSFHFKDHYKGMVEQVGMIIEDLMDKVYDSAREVGIRKPNESAEIVWINDPNQPDAVSTKGDYLVTVSAGPNQDSEREAQAALAELLLESPFAPRIIDLVLKLRGTGPIIDEIAERLTPPEYRQQKDGKPDPTLLREQLNKAMQQIDLLSKELEKRVEQIQTDAVKAQANKELQLELQRMKAETEVRLKEMDNAAAIRVAEINAAVKGYVAEAAHAAKHEEQALNIAAESVENDLSREQETVEADRQRQHEDAQAQAQLQSDAAEAHATREHEQRMAKAKPKPEARV